jgi:hypothetical protein
MKQQMHGAFDDMLVFAPWNVTTLLDILVTCYRPHAQPAERRGLPANALHRYARFALAHWDEDCLEMFIGRALERIEHEIYVRYLGRSRLICRNTIRTLLDKLSGLIIPLCCFIYFTVIRR